MALNVIGVKETYKYVKELLQNKNPIPGGKLYYFTKTLAKSGNTDLFEDLGNHLSPVSYTLFFFNVFLNFSC